VSDTKTAAEDEAGETSAVAVKTADEAAPDEVTAESATDGGEDTPPDGKGKLLADKTWWLPWAIGGAVLIVGAAIIINPFGGDGAPAPETPQDKLKAQIQTTQHTVVYEVTGGGKSPEIKFVSAADNTTEKLEGVQLPWRKEFSITTGPGPAIVQVMVANGGTEEGVACSVIVDGVVVNKNNSPGQFSSVSCSGVVGVVAAPPK
jgi:Mycobacterium membrane protein